MPKQQLSEEEQKKLDKRNHNRNVFGGSYMYTGADEYISAFSSESCGSVLEKECFLLDGLVNNSEVDSWKNR